MTRRHLRQIVLVVVLYVATYGAVLVWIHQNERFYGTVKDLIPLALAVPAAALAAAFQRRASYLQALRDLWRQLIPAVQSAIQYTHLSNPTQADFAKTMADLATVIDLTRGVFANVPAKGTPNGLYPFENLKDILDIISWLGFGGVDLIRRQQARRCITRLWQEMHLALLPEFDRDVPIEAVSKYLHDGRSIADLLKRGELTEEDVRNPRKASHPRIS